MNGLAGARVVIVDDEESEALPIIKEFSKRGIPAVYFDGNISALAINHQRLPGVRLVILDMDLVGGGVPDSSKISTLLGYLSKILSVDNGPYGILLWTKHADLQRLFEEKVFITPDIPKPVFTVCLSKIDCKDAKGNFKINLISSKISKALKGISPLLILQKWEEACFLSATQVTNELASLAVRNSATLDDWRNQWKVEFLQLMRTLAVAEAGQQLDGDSCLSSFYEILNPLHSDRMESNIASLCKSLTTYSAEIMASSAKTDIQAKAKLNTMLHLSVDSANNFYAGNIYTQSKLAVRIPSVKRLLDDFVQGKDEKKKQAKKELVPVSKSVVIEINVTCDHSQNNIRFARFIAGLIVPAEKFKQIKENTGFIYSLGPVFLKSRGIPAGEYYFYFSARHLITTELRRVKNATPFVRLRGQAFGDLQSWFAHRSARPGMLVLTKEM